MGDDDYDEERRRHGYTVDEALCRMGFGNFQGFALFFGGTGWFADAMEISLLSFIGPALKSEWFISPNEESFLSSAIFGGMFIGACFWGFISDAYGRSCQYGDRCKFLHDTPQQSKTNPFGFGTQTATPFQHTNQQQQMPNPFGFGVQNNTQPRGGNDFGSKPNQFKPFENKWSRFSPINSSSASASRQSESQSQATNHQCTDPEVCKRVMVEDLESEKPIWKLTCYGHNRNGPCDIVGDISCEELRAVAYDEAKQGKSLQFIIDRERSLLNSKLVEFQNLVQKPFAAASNSTLSNQSPFAGAHPNTAIANGGVSPPVSSFNQLNASQNAGSAAGPNYAFGQSSAFQNSSQPPSLFQTNNSPFNSSGTFGSHLPHQSVQSSFSFGTASSSNSSLNAHRNPFSTFGNSSQIGNASNSQSQDVSNVPNSALSATGQSSISTPLTGNMVKENPNMDDSIWSKAEWKWNTGEIPEEAPPDIYIR